MDPVTKLCKKTTNEGRGKEFCKHSSFACKELQAKYLKLEEEGEIWLAEKRRYILKLTDYSLEKTALKKETNFLKTELDKFLKEKNEMLQIINDMSHEKKVLGGKLEEISRENEILQTKFDKVLKETSEMIKTTVKDKSHILESSDYSVDKSIEVKLEEMESQNAILKTQLEEKVQIIKAKSQVIHQFLDRQNKVAKCNYMQNLGKILWSFNSAKDKIDVYHAKQQIILQKLEKVEQTCNSCRTTAEKDRQNYEQRIKVLEDDVLNLRFINQQLDCQNNKMKHERENLKQELRKSKKGNKPKSCNKESGVILLPPTPDTPFSDANSIRGNFKEDSQHTTCISMDKKMISKSRKTPLKNEHDNVDGKSEKRAISSQCPQDTVKDSINKSVSRKRIGRKRSSQQAKSHSGIDLDNSTVQEVTNKSVHGKDQKILAVKVIKDAKSSEVINSTESISKKSLNSGFLLDGVTVHNVQRSLSDENEKLFKTDSLNTNKDCIKDLPVLEDEDSSPAKKSPNVSVNFIKQLLPVVEDNVALFDSNIECTSKSSGHTVNRAFTKPSHPVDWADLSSGNYLGDIDAKRVMRSDGWSPPYNLETNNFEHTLHMLTMTPKVLSPLKEVSHSGKVKQRPSIFSPVPSDSSNQSETKVFSEEIGKEPVGTSIGDVFIQEDDHVTRDKNCDRKSSYSQSSNIPRKIPFEDTITGSQGISENEGNVKTVRAVKTRKLKTKKDHKSLKKTVINEEGQINHNKANYNESSKVFEENLTISAEDNLELRVNDNSLPLDFSLKNVKSILGVEKISPSKENNSKINSKRKKDSSKVEASLLETTSGFNFEKSFKTCDPLKRTWDESELEPTESLNCVPLKKWPKTSPLAHYSPDRTTNITTKTVDSDFPHDRSEVKIKKVSKEIKALNSSYSPDSICTSPRSEHFTDFSQVSLRSPTAMDQYGLRQSIKLPKSIQYSACKKRPNSNKAKENSFLTPVKEVVKKPNFVKNGSVKSASNRKNRLDSKSRETRIILAKNRNCDTATSRSVSPSPESMRNYNINSDDSKEKLGYSDSGTCIGLEEKSCKRKLTEDPQSTVDPKPFLLKRLKVLPDLKEEIHRAKQNSNKMETIAIESNSSNSSLSLNGDDVKLVIDVDEEDWLSVSDTGKNSPWVENQTMSCEAEFTMKLTNEGANPLSKTLELYQNTSVTQPIDTKSNTSRNMEPYGARTQLSYNPIIPSVIIPSFQPLPEAMYKYEEKLVKTNTDLSYPENRTSTLNSSESQVCVINFYNKGQPDSSNINNPEAVSEDKCSFPKLSNNSAFKLMSLHQLIPRGDKTLVTKNVLRTVIKKHKENLEEYRKKNILIGRSTDNDAQGRATTKELTTKVLEIFMPLVRKDVTCLSDINRAVDRVEGYEIRVIVRAVMVFLKDAASQALIGDHHAQWMLDCDLPELPNKKSPIVHPKIQISYMFLYLAIERFTKDRSCEEKKKFVDEELHFIEKAFHGVVNEFTDPNWIFWLNLAFIYTLLARNFGFVVRVRQLMYDMFYCFTRRANVVAYAMLKVWSFVLPIRPIEFFSNDPLSLCIILQLTAVPPDVKTRIASKLQALMSRKYRFRFNTVVPDQLLNTCLERLGQSGVHEALVLLAKRQPRDWFLKRPVHQLMEVVEGWSEQKEDCGDVRAVAAIKALCATLRPYQPTSIQQEITKLFNIFVKILSDESTPIWMQEVIVLNFCLLSRVNHSKCLELITKWRPTEISEEVVDQILIDVVGKRPPSWWGNNNMTHLFEAEQNLDCKK